MPTTNTRHNSGHHEDAGHQDADGKPTQGADRKPAPKPARGRGKDAAPPGGAGGPVQGAAHQPMQRHDHGPTPGPAAKGHSQAHSGENYGLGDSPYPPISDYALIGDCHSAALVSRSGSIDWCCIPRFDSGSCFGRLLDWEHGGHFIIQPAEGEYDVFRHYQDHTLVLITTFRTESGEARLYDCFAMHSGGKTAPRREMLRIVEGVRGSVQFSMQLAPRFDYGLTLPWLRREQDYRLYSAIGGENALVIYSDVDLTRSSGGHTLNADFTVRAGERVRTSLTYTTAETWDRVELEMPMAADLDTHLGETLAWWHEWADHIHRQHGPDGPGILRSAIILKALTNAATGAIVAAATTSLPELIGGARNFDYRYSWVRDSVFSARALSDVGCRIEADSFQRFIIRSAAGSAANLQIMYGVGGERQLPEITLDTLDGYQGSRPVRFGNAAASQLQLDAYGELLDLAWRWHRRGNSPDDDTWRFLTELVETAATRWNEPDSGFWEMRGATLHFVFSKVCCWMALDRGIRLAEECMRQAPVRRWRQVRDDIRHAIETEGYDEKRGIFTQAFGEDALDATALLIPATGFLPYTDPRMERTVEAIRTDLTRDGMVLRYLNAEAPDGFEGQEGAFIACTFWLAECLAHQGRLDEAREAFDRAFATDNDLGLFAEEYDPKAHAMLGNFPQALTHLSHIVAAIALMQHSAAVSSLTDAPSDPQDLDE